MFNKEYWAVIVSEDVAELTEQEFPAKNLAKQLGGVAKRVMVTEITEEKPALVKFKC